MFDSVCELFGVTIRNIFRCFFFLLLNVMEWLGVVGGALWDRPCMVSKNACVVLVVPVSV